MKIGNVEKHPLGRKDYPITYTDWLNQNNPVDTIVSATVTIVCLTDPLDTSLTLDDLVISPQVVQPWFVGGVDGHKYEITVIAVTSANRRDPSCFILKVKDC
jgi:hypothetical protein